MKLLTKLTLFITLSKMLIVVFFVLLLPFLLGQVSSRYTNYYLLQQKKKVLATIFKNGMDYYLQGDSSYASYTMLKEEYISLVPAGNLSYHDTIETSRRIVEDDTLTYRLLTHEIKYGKQQYLLEIGKTTATIGQYDGLLQEFTLYTLIALIGLSILIDLLYTHLLLRPLGRIVKTKLKNRKFPFKDPLFPVNTSTTDFKYLDRSLINLMEKIHEAFEKEREFTSNASHELMTPISILQTKIENMIIADDTSEEQQEKLSTMMKTLNRLKKIVHSLLFISRIENEQFAKMETLVVEQLAAEVTEELSHRLESKSIRLVKNISPGLKLRQVNHDLLFQLLHNLVNNAIRYNKEGGTIWLTDNYSPGESYKISVKDSGIGIRAEDLGIIFNRFRKSTQTDGEGYGLGLSIADSIAKYHGAEIKVSSTVGKGTEFSILFPASLAIQQE